MTPPKIPAYDTRRAGDVLDWPAIVDQLSTFANSEPGQTRCRQIAFLDDPSLIRQTMADTSQAKKLLERGISVDLSALTDTVAALTRSKARGVLDAKELLRVADIVSLSRRIRDLLEAEKEDAPSLAQLAEALFAEPSLEKSITSSIERDGSVKDNATHELKKLRGRYHSLHQQINDVLSKMMLSPKFEDVLQDEYFSLRNGRYVMPVKIEKKSYVEGIVHDISSSGQSLFIEPKEVTHLNNLLRTCELEIEREIYSILSGLSFQVADHAGDIETSQRWLTELDFIFAKARYSMRLDATEPTVTTGGAVDLKQVRHPQLVWQQGRVVANDIRLDDERKVLIITGPNTGGKTVALKSVGLCALMVRAGLHIPVAPDSTMSLFRRVFAVIGDEQSILKSLSSFSAHLLGLRYIIENMVPESLVLIDEIGEGTDPNQGVALSKAIIDRLQEKQVRTVITTHFAELTTLAILGSGVANASMAFDQEHFEPTYQLVHGLPGQSSALEIASKLGLDDRLLAKARQFASGTDSQLDEVIQGLQEQQEHLRKLNEQAKQRLQRATEDSDLQGEILEDLKKKKAKKVKEENKRIKDDFDQVRTEINAVLKKLQDAPTYKRIEKARKQIKQIQQNVENTFGEDSPKQRVLPDLLPILDWSALSVGDSVYVSSVDNFGALDALPDRKQNVRVLVAGARLTLSADACYMPPKGHDNVQSTKPKRSVRRVEQEPDSEPVSLSVDLRGMTADEALSHVDEFLDGALRSNYARVTIIHGHGTGVLKREVRQYCKTSSYVKNFRPGQRGEGGDGATVVDLDL